MRRILVPATIDDSAAPSGSVLLALAGQSMGTNWSVRGYAPAASAADVKPALQAAIDERLALVVAQMSHWEAGSELGRFNRAASGTWHRLSPQFFDVLSFALQVAAASGGAFNPCAGALVNLWGFGPEGRHDQPGFTFPRDEQIDAALASGDWRSVELDRAMLRAYQPGGVQLDFSGVAKGYAVDQVAAVLRAHGLAHTLVEVGGELRGAGMKDDRQPWWVGLEQVEGADEDSEVVVALHGQAIATSGDYLRFFMLDGRRYPHTIDPRSGRPIANGVALVTVIAGDCMTADAWSTALTVLGVDDGLRLAETHGLAARLVRRDGGATREVMSSALIAMLQ